MVMIRARAVAASAARPKAPMRLALPANWVKADKTGRAIVSGTRFCRNSRSSAPWKLLNIGKAVNSASVTVSSGTSAMSVVKVRLPAVMPRRSSRKRCVSKLNTCSRSASQGLDGAPRPSPASLLCAAGAPWDREGGMSMLAMMPA